jgi:uncharacterized protein (DUF934 family)
MSPRDTAPAALRVLTRNGVFTHDAWTVVTEAAPAAAGDAALLPLAQYLAEAQPPSRGVWLAPGDDPAALRPHLDALPLIAVAFPVFSDGRGYSIATLLRTRYGYAGDLRAIGDVLVDQLFALKRAGFSSFELRADQSETAALRALHTFSDAYQTSADTSLPAFRRHQRPGAESVR